MEYYGDMPYSESLYHYGVKGMKWGIRRYSDEYARPNAKFNDLYGAHPVKKVKPRTMQRHFNQLDQSFANIHARKVVAQNKASRLLSNAIKKKKADKDDRWLKVYNSGNKNLIQMRNIETMMTQIAANAARNGYSVKSRTAYRTPTNPFYPTVITKGQRVKIRDNGDSGNAVFKMYKNGVGEQVNVNWSMKKKRRR